MPFWRVVVDCDLDRRARPWPQDVEGVVAAVYVWARTIEEAEGLASLALEEEGLDALTTDAIKVEPAAMPQKAPGAVSRSELGYIARAEDGVKHVWDARA